VRDGVRVSGDGGDGRGVGAYADLVEGQDARFFDLEEVGYECRVGRNEGCRATA
jgi:hypothetical protein